MQAILLASLLWSMPFNDGQIRLSDSAAFPPLAACQHVCRFQLAYARTLDRQADGSVEWMHARYRLTAAMELWHLAEVAHAGGLCERVTALQELRWRLGERDYHAGRLPDAAPYERFERVDD